MKSSSEIMAKYFYAMLESGDLRYLLKLRNYDKLPVYNQELLLDAYDSIIKEHEKDCGEMSFTNNLISANYILKENNKIAAMKACYLMMYLNVNKAKEGLREFGENIKDNSPNSLKKLENKIKTLETKMRIKAIRDSNTKKKFINPYYDIIYILENELKGFNEDSLTLKKMDKLINNIKKKNKKLTERYGR